MSLLDELRALDVSDIVSARGSIAAAVNTDDLQALVASGSSVAVLGELGRSLAALQNGFPSPEALIQPLSAALAQLAPQLDARHLPIAPYVEAVREGATLAGRVLSGFGDNPADWGRGGKRALGDALQFVGGKASDLGGRLGASADRHAELVSILEHPPADPRALAGLTLDLALPFPRQSLVALRDGTRGLLERAANINLAPDRTSGLIAAFDVVAGAAASGDPAKLEISLRELRRVRVQTSVSLQDDLRFVAEQVARLRVPQVLGPLVEVSRTIGFGRDGVIEFMHDFARELGEIRFQVEHLDVEPVRAFLKTLPERIEQQARARIEAPVDRMVARTKEVLREFFRRLPVRQYRAEVSAFLHDIARRIDAAGLDAPAGAARGALGEAHRLLTSNSLAAEVQAEMQRLNDAVQGVLDRIEAPLNTIATRVDAVANDAVEVLNRAANALADFQQAIASLHAAVGRLGVHEAEQQVIDALQQLRKKAEDLLSKVPLPEQIRPQLEELTETLRNIDFDRLLQPVRDVAAAIEIPADVAGAVNGGLAEAKRIVDNLIPQALIDSIDAEVEAALAALRGFDPVKLVPDLTAYLDRAAAGVEALDPREAAEALRGPYQTVLDLLDRAHPVTLLTPVIAAYDALMDAVPGPTPQTVAETLGNTLDAAGRVAGRALVDPATRLTPDARGEVGDPSSRRPIETPEGSDDIRPGDVIRLLGHLPGKLRDALAAVQQSGIADVLSEVDSCCGGLARELRAVGDSLAGIQGRVDRRMDELLAPVAAAHARAQLAVHAHFAGGSADVHLDALADAGPASLRTELGPALVSTRTAVRGTAAGAGSDAQLAFARAADALEASPLATLTGSIDDLLAVLDPEPLAREMDLVMSSLLRKAGPLLVEIGADLEAALQRVRAIVSELNPMALAQRFLSVLEVLREELDVLNPRRLAIELSEIHAAIRAIVEAYDPRAIAQALFALSTDVAQQIRALNPQVLLGDVTFWQTAVDRVAQLNPATRLEAVGAALRPVGERLASIDVGVLIEDVNAMAPLLLDAFEQLIEGIRNEIVSLLESLRFSTSSVSASATASVG